MTDTSCHGMDGLPRSRIHAMMMCPPCPRTPVSHVSGLNITRTMTAEREAIVASVILEQPLEVIQLELRAHALAETPAQLLEDAARALHVHLARHLHGRVVVFVTAVHGTVERIGVRLRPRLTAAAGLPGPLPHLLLHLLGEILRALAQRVQRAALAVDGAVGV